MTAKTRSRSALRGLLRTSVSVRKLLHAVIVGSYVQAAAGTAALLQGTIGTGAKSQTKLWIAKGLPMVLSIVVSRCCLMSAV